jgi:hypothetical protein
MDLYSTNLECLPGNDDRDDKKNLPGISNSEETSSDEDSLGASDNDEHEGNISEDENNKIKGDNFFRDNTVIIQYYPISMLIPALDVSE